MTDSKKIFVDTSAWIEFTLKKERYHKEVSAYFSKEIKFQSCFFTSDYVLDETFTRLITRQGFNSAKTYKEKIKQSQVNNELIILYTGGKIFARAWNFFEKFSEHKLSFTDATIVTFVTDLKIDEILTLDRGFKKVGLITKPVL